ncbi:hypothetical protein [Nocardioides antri]|uniref:Uncharacterized protein n=1 Tax=Nocardioides antri TaxID=2607659 RepID=A0A5B1M1U7_9ACTN|nr:hypothetical protein [Nocardioides antri]KAA1426458.1 hypothetical protein F0U47_13730 [Nocardioides antri]
MAMSDRGTDSADDGGVVAKVDGLTWELVHGLATGEQTTDEVAAVLSELGRLGAGNLALLTLTGHAALLLKRLAEATGRSIDDVAADVVELNTFVEIVSDIEDDDESDRD